MNVVDFYSGLRGWSQPWADAGHNIFCVELNPKFPADHRDILDFDPLKHLPWKPDVVLASPPCTWFSVMRIGVNWHHDGTPKTDKARHGLLLVEKTRQLIAQMDPAFWIIENPVDKLRKLPVMDGVERRTVSYCQYGERRMKPTDLWGKFPPSLVLKPSCKAGMPCHDAAPRGSYTGTQGMDSAESAKIPRLLSEAVMEACVKDFTEGNFWSADRAPQGIIQGPHERTKLPRHRPRAQMGLDLGDGHACD